MPIAHDFWLRISLYYIKHGEIPLDKTLAMLHAVELNNEELKLAVKGMENLLGVLSNAHSRLEKTEHSLISALSLTAASTRLP